MSVIQTEDKITALSEGISHDDDITEDNNSISNQKIQLQEYAASHGFTNCVHYCDDGYSGSNFERPAWKPLVTDIEAGTQKAAIRVKGESGKPTTNSAIYGYKKDTENKYHWLIDEEAAAVVRRIFRLTITLTEIQSGVTHDKITLSLRYQKNKWISPMM